MVKLPAGLQQPTLPRVAVYAIAATLITTALFAADAGYRWYRGDSAEVAAPLTTDRAAPPVSDRIVQAPEPVPVEPARSLAPSEPAIEIPERGVVTVEETIGERSVSGSVPIPAPGFVPSTADVAPSAEPPQHKQTEAAQQRKPKDVRRQPEKRSAGDRAKARRPVQAAKPPVRAENRPVRADKPNVYWERDTQLGFAPQLRKRTCNPATGQMPMQCYYPREGREKFPAKPIN